MTLVTVTALAFKFRLPCFLFPLKASAMVSIRSDTIENYLQILHEEFSQVVQCLKLLGDGVFQPLQVGARLLATLHALAVDHQLQIR